MKASKFTEKFPIGTKVKYYPIKGRNDFKETTIRSEAWTLGHGAVVVCVEGVRGGVSIEHIEAR